MKRKLIVSMLCASMVAGMVVVPALAVKADESKGVIGVAMPTQDLQRWNQDGENMKKRTGRKRI